MNPQEIERTEFQTSFRGYDKPEVRNFLRRLARELVQLQSEMNPSDADPGAETGDASSDSADEASASVDVLEAPGSTELAGASDLPQRPSFADAVSSRPDSLDDPSTSDTPVAESLSTVADADLPSSQDLSTGSSVSAYVAPPVTPEGVPSDSIAPESAASATDTAVVETGAVAAPVQTETDDERFQALGDRIAGLLKSAHESAANLSEMAEVEVSEKLAVAEAEADVIRAEAEAQAVEIREAALAEAEELRTIAQLNLAEADELKAKAVSDGRDELKVQREEVDELTNAAFEDRELAMAELTDARGQVTDLLGEARSQSEFLRHEAEEVIRARVRKNMEQAEERLNVLRNSEVASRARIVAAHQELEGAIARLDIEEAPSLPADPEHFALSGAQKRADASNYGQIEADYSTVDEDSDPMLASPGPDDSASSESAITESVTADSATVIDEPVNVAEVSKPDADSSEMEIIEVEVLEPPVSASAASPVADTEADSKSDANSGGGSIYTPPSVEPIGFEAPVVEVETVSEVAEVPVVEASEQLPQRGMIAPEVTTPEVAVPESPLEVPQAPVAEVPVVVPEAEDKPFGQDEDALGRLVRQAMERAVDSARSSD